MGKKSRSHSKRKRASASSKNDEEKEEKVLVEEQKKKQKKKKETEIAISYADDDDDSDDESVVSTEEDNIVEQQNKNEGEKEGDYSEEEDEDGDGEEDEAEEKDEVEEEQNEATPPAAAAPITKKQPTFKSDGRYHNKQRCLVLCSRGVTARYRHLLEDIRTLLPHHKKDSKLDASKSAVGGINRAINDIAEVKNCSTVLFLECRKRGQDAYLWMGFTSSSNSSGPSARFYLSNVHTMDELRLTGNCMKGSRPVLSFDSSFETVPHLKLLKCLFVDVFGTPRGHPKSKPFVDRVMAFYYADGKIWVRNYQILEQVASNAKEAHAEKKATGSELSTSLCEIGPRFVLDPIRIFRGSFGGQTLYQNTNFVPPTEQRALNMRNRGREYEVRKEAQEMKKKRDQEIIVPEDPLKDVFH